MRVEPTLQLYSRRRDSRQESSLLAPKALKTDSFRGSYDMSNNVPSDLVEDSSATKFPSRARELKEIPVAMIRASRFQTREPSAMDIIKLAESIRSDGLLQPICVSPVEDGYFEVIHGHRRFKACQQLGYESIPCIVETRTEEEKARIVLAENLQRKDLNPIEEARGYKALRDEFGYTVTKIAETIGMSRPHVSNRLRLLEADPSIADAVSRETITVAHALLAMAIPPGNEVSRFVDLLETVEPTVKETKKCKRALERGNKMLMFERRVDPKLCRDYLPSFSESLFNCEKLLELFEEGQKEEVYALGDGLVLRGLDEAKAAQVLNWTSIDCVIFVPTSYLMKPASKLEPGPFQATDEEWPLILRPLRQLVNSQNHQSTARHNPRTH